MALEEVMAASHAIDACCLIQGNNTGYWTTVLPSMVNCMKLGGQVWWYILFLSYSIYPPGLPTHFYGCNAKFPICHALDFNKGGLVITFHNDLYYGVSYLAGKALSPSCVRDDPLIHQCCVVQEGKSLPARSPPNNPPETT